MGERQKDIERMCAEINEKGGATSEEWISALLTQIAVNLAVIADVMTAGKDEPQTEAEGE